MDYRYLKAFISTAEQKSFSKAAEDLKIAQSAVSRQIKLLEESVGEELIIRSSKKVLLTEKGKELYLISKTFEETIQDLFATESNKTIRIGILQGLLENWLHSALEKFYKVHENNLEIHVDTPGSLKDGLTNGRLDIIFSTENIQSDLISSLKLFDENLVIISRDKIDTSKLQSYRWIVFNDEDNLLRNYKKVSQNLIKVDSISTIVNFVRAGVGIAVVPDHVLNKTDKVQTTKFTGAKKSEIYLSTLNYKSMPKHLQNLIEFIN